jgi:hypothetical protein
MAEGHMCEGISPENFSNLKPRNAISCILSIQKINKIINNLSLLSGRKI